MGGHGGCDRDGVEIGIREQLVEAGCGAGAGEAGRHAFDLVAVAVADPGQPRIWERVEVARQVRAPVAKADDPDPDWRLHRGDTLAKSYLAPMRVLAALTLATAVLTVAPAHAATPTPAEYVAGY